MENLYQYKNFYILSKLVLRKFRKGSIILWNNLSSTDLNSFRGTYVTYTFFFNILKILTHFSYLFLFVYIGMNLSHMTTNLLMTFNKYFTTYLAYPFFFRGLWFIIFFQVKFSFYLISFFTSFS